MQKNDMDIPIQELEKRYKSEFQQLVYAFEDAVETQAHIRMRGECSKCGKLSDWQHFLDCTHSTTFMIVLHRFLSEELAYFRHYKDPKGSEYFANLDPKILAFLNKVIKKLKELSLQVEK